MVWQSSICYSQEIVSVEILITTESNVYSLPLCIHKILPQTDLFIYWFYRNISILV